MIVAIDGPAGSGKSTTARAVAARLGFRYIDTGAMYRAIALGRRRSDGPASDSGFPDGLEVGVSYRDGQMRVALDGVDVSEEIRRPEIGELASRLSARPEVREKLVAEQRRLAQLFNREGVGVVLDGRDIGTVVFPEAQVKIYMVADPEVRARRRWKELTEKGERIELAAVQEEMMRRDRLDEEREHSPLRKAPDAIELDTSRFSFDEQVQFVFERVMERMSDSSV